ncbi:hypothetical protein ACFYKX_10615 [Cytobacillus sp. FJAT-54145]|uniref:Uncharacterized protein n=1 Tax=Cytobacillus spartinae TaxID=3299023 RepID=A0ABW6KBD9_9BACI
MGKRGGIVLTRCHRDSPEVLASTRGNLQPIESIRGVPLDGVRLDKVADQ